MASRARERADREGCCWTRSSLHTRRNKMPQVNRQTTWVRKAAPREMVPNMPPMK